MAAAAAACARPAWLRELEARVRFYGKDALDRQLVSRDAVLGPLGAETTGGDTRATRWHRLQLMRDKCQSHSLSS